jgi:hypothetical protein
MNSKHPQEVAANRPDSEAASGAADWATIRLAYEDDLGTTLEGICTRHGIGKRALRERIEQEGWTPRRPRSEHRNPTHVVRASPARLISRMFGALERQVLRMEESGMPPTDKEVVLLGSMSRTLGKLMDIDQGRRKEGRAKAAPSADLLELRKKIAERIDQLNRG